MIITIPFAVRPAPRIGGGKSVRRYLPQWYQEQREYLTAMFMSKFSAADAPVCIHVVVSQKGVGRGDTDNIAKPVLDALQRAHVIPNDSLKHVRRLLIEGRVKQASEYTIVSVSTEWEAA